MADVDLALAVGQHNDIAVAIAPIDRHRVFIGRVIVIERHGQSHRAVFGDGRAVERQIEVGRRTVRHRRGERQRLAVNATVIVRHREGHGVLTRSRRRVVDRQTAATGDNVVITIGDHPRRRVRVQRAHIREAAAVARFLTDDHLGWAGDRGNDGVGIEDGDIDRVAHHIDAIRHSDRDGEHAVGAAGVVEVLVRVVERPLVGVGTAPHKAVAEVDGDEVAVVDIGIAEGVVQDDVVVLDHGVRVDGERQVGRRVVAADDLGVAIVVAGELAGAAIRRGGGGGDHVANGHAHSEGFAERDVAAGVGDHISRTEEDLALVVSGRIARRAGEELDAVRGFRVRVERAFDGDAARTGQGAGDDRVVLEVVGAGVGVARVVFVHGEQAAKLDAQPAARIDLAVAVAVDRVAQERVARAAAGVIDAVTRVVGDDVACAGVDAADRVVGGKPGEPDARVAVAHRVAVGVHTNGVALHNVVVAQDVDAVRVVAGDEVAFTGVQPADGVAVRRRARADGADDHTRGGVAQIDGAGDIGADVVALHDVGLGFVGEKDAVAVGRDDVALTGARAADQVVAHARSLQDDAFLEVAHGDGAGGVGADEVALNDVAQRHAADVHAHAAGAADRLGVGNDVVADDVVT